ncbi:flagellar hook-length control protein FliK [Erwinia pyrifoliae]|uniref:Flagellar hook-length control protein FliK n=1 Tax=Erwinia pyrifoliae TaxID=79967 RepID=A0ABY5X3Q2_ERWPY|nr:flagellar hook-length control protein FliK [Erwinia pyrifoliae]MCT2388723.1 flagellar hook-length control protein FliK [Erwinia pyrifoliae]MCU8586892.1 flagellar hook-length control protein FliK [Erwinia pyrifoliae]UWS30763.1 flagellar hook-length control protein FliK [Erwinia pyrifoliae]UWS32011.1 flagellar hook-length control protein FliK [Erwinia pyrifoliae]
MITLPTAVTSTSPAPQGASSMSSENTLDGRAGDDALSGAENMPKGFVTLLGERLLSLGHSRAASGRAGETANGAAPTGKSAVNPLLANLDNPETLSALLQPATGDSAKKDDAPGDKQPVPLAALSESDVQALQALYAMLPNNVTPPASAATGLDKTDAAPDAGDKQSALGALITAFGKASAEKGNASDSALAKDSDGLPLAKSAGKPDGETRTALNPALPSGNPAFQQMMHNANRDADKQDSVPVQNAMLTPVGLTSAATAFTPTTTSVVSAPSTPLLNAQLGSPEWQQALGQQILMFSRDGLQTAELRLHPQDLGSIQISLKLDNDQAQISLVSNHSQVRDALEAAIPQLRTSLAESGINLGQSNVSSDAFQQGKSFHGQQEQQRDHHETPFSLGNDNDDDATPIAVPASLQARISGTNAVDTFA